MCSSTSWIISVPVQSPAPAVLGSLRKQTLTCSTSQSYTPVQFVLNGSCSAFGSAGGVLGVFLFVKGFQAVQCARAANYFWREANGEGRMIAKLLQSEMADVYGVDIHPGARFGRGDATACSA